MLVVETVVRIRREHAGGKPIKAIARDLRLSRKVVRKAIRAPEGAFDYHRAVQPLPRIGPFQERLDALLVENEARHRRDRLRMTRIHDLLLREGFEGSYDAVRRYAARWSAARRKDAGDGMPAFIPLLFMPGEAYQFDWSHEDVEIAGKPMRVKVAHMRLCASRAVYVRAYRPHVADGAYMLRRRRKATIETDAKLAAYVTDRLSEGWTPEQIAGRLRLGIERGLRAVCAETIYGWIYRAGQKTERLWRCLTRHHARRRKRHGRASRDTIAEKTHISQRAGDADARETVGHWEADLVICRRSRPVLVLHERKTRITLMTRLAGKTAAETIAAMTAIFRRLDPRMRGSVTFDNDTCFARHMLLRGMLSATTYFCDAYASWQKGGVENANGRCRASTSMSGTVSQVGRFWSLRWLGQALASSLLLSASLSAGWSPWLSPRLSSDAVGAASTLGEARSAAARRR